MNMPLTALWVAALNRALVCAFLGSKAKYAALVFSTAFLGAGHARLASASRTCLRGHQRDRAGLGVRHLLPLVRDALSIGLIAADRVPESGLRRRVLGAGGRVRATGPASWRSPPALTGVFLARDLFFFYVFWGSDLDPDVLHHRPVGLEQPPARRGEVLPVHVRGLGVHAAGVCWRWSAPITALTGVWTWDLAVLDATTLGSAAAARVLGRWSWASRSKSRWFRCTPGCPTRTRRRPPPGSVMLAGVMLKMGVYGFLRVALPLFPDLVLGRAAVARRPRPRSARSTGALCAMAQTDLKRMIAYSSIAHLGFCLLGVLSRTRPGPGRRHFAAHQPRAHDRARCS